MDLITKFAVENFGSACMFLLYILMRRGLTVKCTCCLQVKNYCTLIKTIYFEKKIFEKSISFEPKKFTRLRSEIAEELSEIGELSDYIIEGGKTKDTDLLDMFSGALEDTFENNDNHNNYINEPITKETKVGRNDPCPCGSGKKYKKCCGKN